MSKRFFIMLALVALCVGMFATTAAQADCGGNYKATVEADTGQGVTYCSDGTIEPFVPADGDGTSSCGGVYAASVEVETVEVQPGLGVGYCSDGTIQGIEELVP